MKQADILKLLDVFVNPKAFFPISNLYCNNLISDNCFGRVVGKDDYIKASYAWKSAFPDWHIKKRKIEVCKNIAVVSYEYAGTYLKQYEFPNIDLPKNPTLTKIQRGLLGSEVTSLISECTYIFDQGKISRMHIHSDLDNFYEQLGVGGREQLLSHIRSCYQLSKREVECVALHLSGFSAKSIAASFFLSPRTVETHLQHAYLKLNCSGKKECIEVMRADGSLTKWHEMGHFVMDGP